MDSQGLNARLRSVHLRSCWVGIAVIRAHEKACE